MKKRPFFLVPIFMSFCLLSSCCYKAGVGGELSSRYSSISVPYITGDQNGLLTSCVIKEIVNTGAFDFRYCGASLILGVTVIDIDEENIGFRYDRKKRGKLTKDIIPTEARMSIVVEISVTEATSGNLILGPVKLAASVDYDHDYYSSRDGVNIFSLGQLSDLDEAYDTAKTPLYKAIAIKIADYITNSW